MKKIFLILLMTVGFIFSCKAQTQSDYLNTYTTEIIGTWVSETNSSYKIEFLNNETYKVFIDDNLEGVFEYKIVTTCNFQDNGYDVYLKLKNDRSTNCEIINNIDTDENGVTTLSITSENGKLETYIKN